MLSPKKRLSLFFCEKRHYFFLFNNILLSASFSNRLSSQLILPGSDGTRHPGAFETTVALGILLQVLLVVVLRIVELLHVQNLCRDGTVTLFIQLLGTKHTHISQPPGNNCRRYQSICLWTRNSPSANCATATLPTIIYTLIPGA